jgi:hypothetical protein
MAILNASIIINFFLFYLRCGSRAKKGPRFALEKGHEGKRAKEGLSQRLEIPEILSYFL